MAGRGLHRLLAPVGEGAGPTEFASAGDEFDESEVWGGGLAAPESRKPAARVGRKKAVDHAATGAGSLPVSIPDWSKILRQEYKGNRGSSLVEEEDVDAGGGEVIPPHELLCRSRGASFSVHEGIGRTLKGRDLRRVRNAVWEQTGFQD